MDDGSRISWLILILLFLGAMFFAFAETAFASVSRTRLRARVDRGDSRAKKALYVTENIDRAITTILIGTNITHLAAASIVTVNVTRIWGVSAVTLSTLLTTLAVFFFAEMLPKSIARKYAETISLASASLLCFLMTVLRPFSALLAMIGNSAAKLLPGEAEASVTENELYDIIEDMTEAGTLDEDQGELISSALQFGDVTVESILTSRVDVAAIDIAMPQEEILAFIKEQTHSRLPVYEDTIDNVIGILQVRNYIRHYLRQGKYLDMRPLLEEPMFVHQSTKIDDLLPVMSVKKQNVAIVLENYGGMLGIVTVEDILEELVGEIWDEDDQIEETFIRLQDGTLSVDPEEHVIDVLDELDIHYTEEQEEEILNKQMSELTYETLPSIPREGDHYAAYGMKVTVLSMDHNRILRLKAEETQEDPEKGGAS